jgi:pilus assembly protein CpaB
MGAVRIAILAVAGIAAIALAFLVKGMTSPTPAPTAPAVAAAPPSRPMAQVLVAKTDLGVGHRITAADLAWQAWPVEALNANFITDGSPAAPEPKGPDKALQKAGQAADKILSADGPMHALEGALVKEPLLAHEPITPRKVVRAGQTGYMAVVLAPGMRAIAIPVTAETGAGGFILPGDRVDVLQSHEAEGGEKGAKAIATEILLRNIRVLAIDQTTAPVDDAKTVVGAVATLEVQASDADVLARGRARGEMILALRSYADIGGPSGRGGPGSKSEQTVQIVRAGAMQEVAVR